MSSTGAKAPTLTTYDPAYENLLRTAIVEILSDTRAPLRELIDLGKVLDYISQPSDYGRPLLRASLWQVRSCWHISCR